MKFINALPFLVLLTILFACSKNESNELSKTILISTNIEISVPESFELEQLQGIDSYVANIIDTNDDAFTIYIDIGQLAGFYVDEDSESREVSNSVNREFWFEDRESGYLGGEDCCLFYTFPNLGPANFIARNNEYKALVLEIMKSLREI